VYRRGSSLIVRLTIRAPLQRFPSVTVGDRETTPVLQAVIMSGEIGVAFNESLAG